MGTAISYSELDRLSRAFAAYLQSVLKLKKGARVALMMPNILQYPVALFGALRAGYTVVNCNPLYSPRELEHQLADSGAEVVVIAENFASVLAKVIARTTVQHVVTTQLGDMLGFPKNLAVNFVVKSIRKMVPAWNIPGAVSFKSVLRRGATQTFETVDVSPDDLAFLQYTGGTTGSSKRRHAQPWQYHRQPAAVARVAQARARRGPRESSSPHCRCTTSSRSRRIVWCS